MFKAIVRRLHGRVSRESRVKSLNATGHCPNSPKIKFSTSHIQFSFEMISWAVQVNDRGDSVQARNTGTHLKQRHMLQIRKAR